MPIFTYDTEKHEYTRDGVVIPSLTEILQSVGIVDAAWFNDYARDRGTFVHQATALWDKGTLDEDNLDPQLFMYLAAWRLFKVESGIFMEHMDIENPYFHDMLSYGCTPDRVADGFNNRQVIIEIKTNKLPWWCAIQTAGQELAVTQGVGPHAPRLRRIGVELHADGTYKMQEYTDRNDREVFLGALAVHQRKLKEMKP